MLEIETGSEIEGETKPQRKGWSDIQVYFHVIWVFVPCRVSTFGHFSLVCIIQRKCFQSIYSYCFLLQQSGLVSCIVRSDAYRYTINRVAARKIR
jgi:hypothetical protein